MCPLCRYDNKEEAQQAIDMMNNSTPPGASAPLVVRIAEEHGKQKAAYYAGMQAGMRQNQRTPNSNYGTVLLYLIMFERLGVKANNITQFVYGRCF